MVDNIERYCMHFRDEVVYLEIQKEYEGILGMRLLNQQIEQLQNTEYGVSNVYQGKDSESNKMAGFISSAFSSDSVKNSHFSQGMGSRHNDEYEAAEIEDEKKVDKY